MGAAFSHLFLKNVGTNVVCLTPKQAPKKQLRFVARRVNEPSKLRRHFSRKIGCNKINKRINCIFFVGAIG
jgi:hypothetical protein